MRFVHTADLHLDAPFQGVSAVDDRAGRALAYATYEALRRIVDTCIEREAAFLVISGDAYNSADKSLRAQLAFRSEMQRLADAGIRAFIVHGNHDPASGWSAGLALPDSVHVFSADGVERVEVERDGEVVAAVYGRSFRVRAETQDFSAGYERQAGDPFAVGVLHANVGGDPNHDPYAPATVEGLRSRGMDYWALGHIHKHEVLARDPWIVYAGSPQGLNPKETGAHGCVVVEVSDGRVSSAEFVEVASVVWAHAAVDVSGAIDLDDVRTLITDACARMRSDAARPLVARLSLDGRSEAHDDLARDGVVDDMLDDVRREQLGAEPWLWIDRLENRSAGVIDLEQVSAGADFAAELVHVARDLEADEARLNELLAEITKPVAATLSGYEPGAARQDLLARARDRALDLLLTGGDER